MSTTFLSEKSFVADGVLSDITVVFMGDERTVVDLIFCIYAMLVGHSFANYPRGWVRNNGEPCITTSHVEVFFKSVCVQIFPAIQSLSQLFLPGTAGVNLILGWVEFRRCSGQAIAMWSQVLPYYLGEN